METKCGRCQGKGIIKAFLHVRGGICFRCWGCGVDSTNEINGLNAWLTKARAEFRRRQAALKAAKDPAVRAKLQAELAQIEKLGKKNRKKYDRLVADRKHLQERAKEMNP